MNCNFEIDVNQVPTRWEEFESADAGLATLTSLLDSGAIRISKRNEAAVRALRKALNDRWTLLEQYKQANTAPEVRKNVWGTEPKNWIE